MIIFPSGFDHVFFMDVMWKGSYCNHLLQLIMFSKRILFVRLLITGTVIMKYNSSQNLDLVNKRMCFCEWMLSLMFKETDIIKKCEGFLMF